MQPVMELLAYKIVIMKRKPYGRPSSEILRENWCSSSEFYNWYYKKKTKQQQQTTMKQAQSAAFLS